MYNLLWTTNNVLLRIRWVYLQIGTLHLLYNFESQFPRLGLI